MDYMMMHIDWALHDNHTLDCVMALCFMLGLLCFYSTWNGQMYSDGE